MAATRSVPTAGYDGASFAYGKSLNWTWRWACGPEADTVIGAQYANSKGMRAAGYANWHSGEPNGRGVPGVGAAYEGFGQYGYGSYGRWNDLPDATIRGIQGYYVEFGGYPGETLTTPRAMDARTVTDLDCADALAVAGGLSEDAATAILSIEPTDPAYKYAVVDEDGKVVPTAGNGAWTAGTGEVLIFGGLTPGKAYHIVSVPVDSSTDADQGVVDTSGQLTDWDNGLTNSTAKIQATVVAPVAPGQLHPIRNGGTVSVPEATDTTKDYALVDSKGNPVTDWVHGASGGLTFEGLDPNETYTLVESGHVDADKTPDPVRLYDPAEGVKVLPVPAPEDMIGAYDADAGKSSITVDPAQPGLTYTATPAGGGDPIRGVAATDENGVTTVTFPGLEPGGAYRLSVSDGAGNATDGPSIVAPAASAARAERESVTGVGGVQTDTVTLPGETTDGAKVYALVDANGAYINPDGSPSVDSEGNPTPVWFPGTGTEGGDLVWEGLDPDVTYRVLTADKDGAGGAPVPGSVPAQTTLPPQLDGLVHAEIDPETGKGVVTVGPVVPGETYMIGGVEYTADGDGMLTAPGLTPGQSVTVTAPHGGETAVTVPAVSARQVGGKVEPNGTAATEDDAILTITPSVPGAHYAVVDKATGKLVTEPRPGNGGTLTFEGLKPNAEYQIVALPDDSKHPGDDAGEDALKSAVDALTNFTLPVDPDQVSRGAGTDAGKDQLTLSDTDAGVEYAVIDRSTGQIVAPAPGLGGVDEDGDGWVMGNGGSLVFDGLDPNQLYDVVTRAPASGSTPAGVPSDPVTVLPATGSYPDNVDQAADAGGRHSITVDPSDPDTKYAVVDVSTGKVVAPINGGGGDGWVTGTGGALALGTLPPGDYAVVSVPRAADDSEAPGQDTVKNDAYPDAVAVPGDAASNVTVPVVTADQLSGGVTGTGDDARASITIQPADPDLVYGVVDKNGDPIPGVEDKWVEVGPDGSVTIPHLPTGQEIQVVAKPKNDDAPAKPSGMKDPAPGSDNFGLGTAVMTADGQAVTPDGLTRKPDSATGKDTLTVSDAKSGYLYTLVDAATGKPVETQEGTGGALTFTGLAREGSYAVKVSKKPAGDALPMLSPGPVAVPTVGLDGIRADAYVEGSPATASIAIVEPKSGVAYGVKGGDGKIVWADAQGVVKGLTPDAEYTIVTKPSGAADSAAVKGCAIKTPGAPVVVDRDADATDSAKDQLTFTVPGGKSYAVVDEDGKYYELDGSALADGAEPWKAGGGDPVTVKGLDPAKTYTVLVKDAAAEGAIPSAAESKPNSDAAVPADSVSAAVDGQGTASVTVAPTADGARYVVVDKDNKVVAAGSGNGGALVFSGETFPGILPGQTYTVAMVDAPVSVGDTVTPGRGAVVSVPVTGTNGVTTGVDPADSGKRTITVKPTAPGVDYLLVTPDGAQVGTAIPGKDDHAPITFTGLEPNTLYHVVTVPHGAEYVPAAPARPGVRTPSGELRLPTEAEVKKTQTTVTIAPTVEGQSYNLMDESGKLVGQWVPGSGQSVTFSALSPNSTYTVVVMQPDADGAQPGDQSSGIVTGPAVTTSAGSHSSGGSGSSSSGAASSAVRVNTSKDGTVTLSPTAPRAGDKVTVTVKPGEGKAVDQLVVTDRSGTRLEVIDNQDGTYTYIQPDRTLAPVTVTVSYKSVTGDPDSNGVSDLLVTDEHIAYLRGDDQGAFRPGANMTRAEVAQMFYNLLRSKNVSGGETFSDVPADAWYATAVRALSGLGAIKGYGDGTYAPAKAITRAEFVTIAARFADRTTGTVTFSDVSESHWAYDTIGQAAYYGWVQGNEAGGFRPDAPITRAEAVRIVNTMLGRGGDKSYIDAHSAALRQFPDVGPGHWAYYEIAEAANAHGYTKADRVETWDL